MLKIDEFVKNLFALKPPKFKKKKEINKLPKLEQLVLNNGVEYIID